MCQSELVALQTAHDASGRGWGLAGRMGGTRRLRTGGMGRTGMRMREVGVGSGQMGGQASVDVYALWIISLWNSL